MGSHLVKSEPFIAHPCRRAEHGPQGATGRFQETRKEALEPSSNLDQGCGSDNGGMGRRIGSVRMYRGGRQTSCGD